MSDHPTEANPLEDSPERAARIQDRARQLWQEDGSPAGQEKEFRERAETLIGMEESAGAGLLPNPMTLDEKMPGVVVEEAAIQDNYGEAPGRMTDQGETRQTPMTRQELRHEEQAQEQENETEDGPD